ncbi:MAG TPA: DinB family protein [Thermoanaerobaculia bacterium]|nr:DinB family protein [Thermoanaerobaculia bacterium]
MSNRDLFLRMLDDAYQRKAWHGPNLRGSLRGLTDDQASWRPARGRHSIWELAVHCAYWKYAVRRRLIGLKRGTFPRKGSNWLPPSGDWNDDLRLLANEQRELLDAIRTASSPKLRAHERLIYGVAAHDVYHTGQIQLIKRLGGFL